MKIGNQKNKPITLNYSCLIFVIVSEGQINIIIIFLYFYKNIH